MNSETKRNDSIDTSPSCTGANRRSRPSERRGATMVMVAIMLPMLITIAAFAINIVHLQSLNTDVQIASDAAAMAASQRYFESGGDKGKAKDAAQEAAALNPIGDNVLPIEADDLEYGVGVRSAEGDTYTFTPQSKGNAIRIVTRTLASGSQSDIRPLFAMPGMDLELKSERESICTRSVLDLSLVVDRSGSMAYAVDEPAQYPPAPASAPAGWDFGDPVPPNARWWDLLAALQVLHDELVDSPLDEHVNLILYDDESANTVPLTTDYSRIGDELVAVSNAYEAGGTNIGGAMHNGSWVLNHSDEARPYAAKVMLLLTDGIHNYGTSPASAADHLAGEVVTVFTVTFSDEADQAAMQNVAAKCGGEHYHASNGSELKDAFREIVRKLPILITK